MKYFTGIILSVVIFSACSTPEVLSDEPVEIETGVILPEWYSANKISSADSTHFNGYSMATAVDSVEAINSGTESAIANLRYEIDRFTEQLRETLVNGRSDGWHGTPQFIIQLRNTVQELTLTDSNIDRDFGNRDDDIFQVYIRATMSRSEVIDRLSNLLSDEAFNRALHTGQKEL